MFLRGRNDGGGGGSEMFGDTVTEVDINTRSASVQN
jgi:hypothetical protein